MDSTLQIRELWERRRIKKLKVHEWRTDYSPNEKYLVISTLYQHPDLGVFKYPVGSVFHVCKKTHNKIFYLYSHRNKDWVEAAIDDDGVLLINNTLFWGTQWQVYVKGKSNCGGYLLGGGNTDKGVRGKVFWIRTNIAEYQIVRQGKYYVATPIKLSIDTQFDLNYEIAPVLFPAVMRKSEREAFKELLKQLNLMAEDTLLEMPDNIVASHVVEYVKEALTLIGKRGVRIDNEPSIELPELTEKMKRLGLYENWRVQLGIK